MKLTSRQMEARRKGAYGIDAPYLLPVPLLLIGWNIVQGILSKTLWPFGAAALIGACVGCGLYTSRCGKFIVWAKLLNEIKPRGDERILDIGCGRGAVLLI